MGGGDTELLHGLQLSLRSDQVLVVARMTVMKKLDVFDASYTCLLIAMRTGVTHCLTLPALTLLRRLEVQ